MQIRQNPQNMLLLHAQLAINCKEERMKNNNWIYQVFLWTFILSIVFSYATNVISSNSTTIVTAIIIICVIAIGILFDMLGASSLTSKEASFHAMAAKKINFHFLKAFYKKLSEIIKRSLWLEVQ